MSKIINSVPDFLVCVSVGMDYEIETIYWYCNVKFLILEEYLILWFRYFVSNCNWNCWLNLWISMWSMVHSWKYLQFFNVTNVHFRVLNVDLRRHYGGSMIKDMRKSSISSKFQAWVRGEVNSFYDNMKVW